MSWRRLFFYSHIRSRLFFNKKTEDKEISPCLRDKNNLTLKTQKRLKDLWRGRKRWQLKIQINSAAAGIIQIVVSYRFERIKTAFDFGITDINT